MRVQGSAQELTSDDRGRAISRRSLLLRGGGGVLGLAALSGAGGVGYLWPRRGATTSSAAAATAAPPRFRSEPALDPPRVTVVNLEGGSSSGLIFITPSVVPGERITQASGTASGLGQEGAMALDQFGKLVWFLPLDEIATNLRVQSYRGEPVLTYWHGNVVDGIGKGQGVILDTSYRQIATVKAGNGVVQDLHDFTLTPQNTALITAYRPTTTDLRSVGSKQNAPVQDSIVQEIDVASGKVLFEWHSLDHVPVEESQAKPVGDASFDYFHVNSVEPDGDTHLLVSSRNTWTVYRVERATGTVTWRLGGKNSDFPLDPTTRFAWQHHASRMANGDISIFDDESTPQIGPQSRAIILRLDESAMKATLAAEYTHPAKLVSEFEGSAQVLPNGHMFVGWGGEPYFSEFDADGTLVLDGRLPTNDQSYRAFRMPWSATPATPPKIALESDEINGTTVYASWNGATDVASWEVLAGSSPALLSSLVTVPHSAFETAITIHTSARYIAAAALDKQNRRLATSRAVQRY